MTPPIYFVIETFAPSPTGAPRSIDNLKCCICGKTIGPDYAARFEMPYVPGWDGHGHFICAPAGAFRAEGVEE